MSAADRLYAASADQYVSLGYDRDVHTRQMVWTATINVARPGRGIRKADRLRRGWGPTPDAALRDLERRLEGSP